MTAEEIRNKYHSIGPDKIANFDPQSQLLAELTAQVAELNQSLFKIAEAVAPESQWALAHVRVKQVE